jgi:nitrite reductase (NADH) small subunit
MSEVKVGALEDIPIGEGRAYAIEDAQVAVFRLRDGTLRAIDAVCPHRGGPLADGLIDGAVVVCPLHGHTFDMCSGAEVGGDLSVRSYRVSSVDGSIRLQLDD